MDKVFNDNDFNSGDGMLTSVWGPGLWHTLHTISFNYPVKPTKECKNNYYNFFILLEKILPCKYCRINYSSNLKSTNFCKKVFTDRETLSRWVFNSHNHVNEMLHKKCDLTYEQVRDRYENFRARCNLSKSSKQCTIKKTKKKKELGCTNPLYGVKSKCILSIVPVDCRKKTFKMDPRCKCKRKFK